MDGTLRKMEEEEDAEEEADAVVKDAEVLEIEADYYSLAFVCFIKYYQKTHTITRLELSNTMYNVLFVFNMQMALIALICYDFAQDFGFIKCKMAVAISRFICAYLLHFAMEPEFRQSLKML